VDQCASRWQTNRYCSIESGHVALGGLMVSPRVDGMLKVQRAQHDAMLLMCPCVMALTSFRFPFGQRQREWHDSLPCLAWRQQPHLQPQGRGEAQVVMLERWSGAAMLHVFGVATAALRTAVCMTLIPASGTQC
jgi:hypothetical protein